MVSLPSTPTVPVVATSKSSLSSVLLNSVSKLLSVNNTNLNAGYEIEFLTYVREESDKSNSTPDPLRTLIGGLIERMMSRLR